MEKTTFPGPWNLEEFQEKSSFEDFVYDMNYASKVFKKLNKSGVNQTFGKGLCPQHVNFEVQGSFNVPHAKP